MGSHKGTIDDDYVCSSKLMLEQYNQRPRDFTRQIVAEGTYDDCLMLETKILKTVDAKLNENFYNLHNGDGKFYNKQHSDETKAKIGRANSIALLGKKHSEKTKQKMSLLRKGKKHPPRSEETRLKLSQSKLGRKLSEETKRKIGVASTGRKHKPESIEKMRGSKVGKPRSNECKQKISAGLLGNQCHAKKYIIIEPTGNEIEIFNLKKFCKNNRWPYKYVGKKLKSGSTYRGYSLKQRSESSVIET